uniref:Uncharacterized protein n=1 Tax=Romanomermis culicivorax TaxID=13658 RepID=A0A915L7Y5_ROMCU
MVEAERLFSSPDDTVEITIEGGADADDEPLIVETREYFPNKPVAVVTAAAVLQTVVASGTTCKTSSICCASETVVGVRTNCKLDSGS